MPSRRTQDPPRGETRRAVVYVRVSSRDQVDGYSIPAQRKACLARIDDEGWEVAGEFVDSGESARTQDRPQFQAMLQAMRDDPSISVLVVHKLDRLARNLEDHVAVKAVLRQRGVQLVSVTESFEESASGRLVEGIMASIAEFYSANLAQEVRKGMNEKARRGGWPTVAPVGYRNVRTENPGSRRGEAVIVPDPDQAPLVRLAFERYATGEWTLRELHTDMSRRGLRPQRSRKPLSRSKLAAMLKNPVYIGKVIWSGEEYEGVHKPLVSEEIFNRVQEVFRIHDAAGVRRRRQGHYLRGTLYCGRCGARMSSMRVKEKYTYFYCLGGQTGRTDCSEPYARADDLEPQVADLYRSLRLPEAVAHSLREDLTAELRDRTTARRRAAELLERQRNRLEAEREKAMEAYYDGAITSAKLKAERQRIEQEIGRLEVQHAEVTEALGAGAHLIETALTLAENLHRAYLRAGPQVRRRYNQALLGHVYVDGGTVSTAQDQTMAPTGMSTGSLNGTTHGPAS